MTSSRQIPYGLRHRSRSASPANGVARSISPCSTISAASNENQDNKTKMALTKPNNVINNKQFSNKRNVPEPNNQVPSRQTQNNRRNIPQKQSEFKLDLPSSSRRRQEPFDTLTPTAAYLLSNVQPYSVYGDKPYVSESDSDAATSTSTSTSTTGARTGARRRQEPDSDDDSADEGDEPDLNAIDLKHLPQLNLRPEKIDNIYTPEYARGDRRKYDFDATNTVQPEYLFAHPLSEEMVGLQTCLLSKDDKNWRDLVEHVPDDVNGCSIFDRMIELGRLQARTEDWESAKRERIAKQARLCEEKPKAGATVKYQSVKLRERKCCADCMQLLCNVYRELC